MMPLYTALSVAGTLESLPEAVKIIMVLAVAGLGLLVINLVSRRKKPSRAENSVSAPDVGALSARGMALPNPAPMHPDDEALVRNYLNKLRGRVTLTDTDERSAAVIMAIISHNTGIPLDRLIFTSIRLKLEPVELNGVSERDAAVIMALTSHISGIPLERLMFKSIKPID